MISFCKDVLLCLMGFCLLISFVLFIDVLGAFCLFLFNAVEFEYVLSYVQIFGCSLLATFTLIIACILVALKK